MTPKDVKLAESIDRLNHSRAAMEATHRLQRSDVFLTITGMVHENCDGKGGTKLDLSLLHAGPDNVLAAIAVECVRKLLERAVAEGEEGAIETINGYISMLSELGISTPSSESAPPLTTMQ